MADGCVVYILYAYLRTFFFLYNSYNSTTIKKENFPSTVQTLYLYIRRTRPAHCGDYHCKAFNRQSFRFFFFQYRNYAFLFDSRRKMIFLIRARRSYITIMYPTTAWVGHMANYEISNPCVIIRHKTSVCKRHARRLCNIYDYCVSASML